MIERLLPERVRPVVIPPITRRRYLSFHAALNLRIPEELTGDWHFHMTLYSPADDPPVMARLAGEGMDVDTTPSFGSRGVRNMADVMVSQSLREPDDVPVWVANHYRAIANLAVQALHSARQPYMVTVNEVNQWLDTPGQVNELVHDRLEPLRGQIEGDELER